MLFQAAPPRFAVGNTPDLERVLALPRRAPTSPEEIEAWSAALRRPGATGTLRELYYWRGLFAPNEVGSGKTLPTFLAPTVLGVERSVLIVPGGTVLDKTRADYVRYASEGWRVTLPDLVSYQELGREDRETKLFDLAPQLLILDEADYAFSKRAACTRRIKRAIEALRPIVMVLSGTLITDQLEDYHHLLVWALGDRAPVPLSWAEAEPWAKALDAEVGLLERVSLGALERLPGGFHEHMRGSAGVVPTTGSRCKAAIEIRRWRPELPKILRDAIAYVETTKARPDGEPLDEWDLPDCLCQLAQGFFYVWDPLPPDWWLAPRRGWRMYASAVLNPPSEAEQIPGLDSEGQLCNAIDAGRKTVPALAEARQLLAGWRAVKDQFVPNPVPIWLDDSPLRQAAQVDPGTLIWTRHRAAGHRLEQLGVPYYRQGTNPENAPHGTTIAVSVSAHHKGFNLQYGWHRNLFLVPMAKPKLWEQGIGRTHREGQRAETVHVLVNDSIDYHRAVTGRVLGRSRRIGKASGFDQKLLAARWIE
jgi:hypothetical protein